MPGDVAGASDVVPIVVTGFTDSAGWVVGLFCFALGFGILLGFILAVRSRG